MDRGVVAVAVEGGRCDHPQDGWNERPPVAAEHARPRQSGEPRRAHGAPGHVVPRGVRDEDAQGRADQRVAQKGREEGERKADHERRALDRDATLRRARGEREARQLDAFADDGDDEEREPPRDHPRGVDPAPPQQYAAQTDERPQQLDEHGVARLPARPHVAVDARQGRHSRRHEESRHHSFRRESGQVCGCEARDRKARQGIPDRWVQRDDDRAHAAGSRQQGGRVRPDASPVRLQRDRALQAYRSTQEAVDHEESVDRAERGRGDRRQGAQAHEGGVQAGEQGCSGQGEEGQASDGQGRDRGRRARRMCRGVRGGFIGARGPIGGPSRLAHVGSPGGWRAAGVRSTRGIVPRYLPGRDFSRGGFSEIVLRGALSRGASRVGRLDAQNMSIR